MKNFRKSQLVKHTLYVVLFLLTYVLQITPRLFKLGGAKPFLLISVAVLLSMYEGEFIGGIYGAFAGLLCDTASFSLFGFNAFLLCALCAIIGLLSVHLMQPHIANALLFTAIAVLVVRNLQFLFSFGIFGYDSLGTLYLSSVLLPSLYTVAATAVLFFPLRLLFTKLTAIFE